MTNRNAEQLEFPGVNRRRVAAAFSGGDVSSDGGVLLLRQVDRRLGLTAEVARLLDDPRRKASCEHDLLSIAETILGKVVRRNVVREDASYAEEL